MLKNIATTPKQIVAGLQRILNLPVNINKCTT